MNTVLITAKFPTLKSTKINTIQILIKILDKFADVEKWNKLQIHNISILIL